jgi:inorganic phosphate transporter, PiT family
MGIYAPNEFMILALLFLATCFVAYSNGANDNFKGVASLFGSRTCTYRTAIVWATVTTFAGSVAAIFLAETLLNKFSGKGLVPDALTNSGPFVLAVTLGAGATIILATLLGFPVSTTHGLTGALVGAGFAAKAHVNIGALGKSFVLPLVLSPALALAVGAGLYLGFRWLRLRLGIQKELCVCVGVERQVLAMPQPAGVFAAQSMPQLAIVASSETSCTQRYAGRFFGLSAGGLVNALHFLSAGAVSFARGLNDTPKIAALLAIATTLDMRWGLVWIAIAMALGGLLSARKVAQTMSYKITGMNPGQGFTANLSTALLVTTASVHGLPVSTTHVSVGALLGMGIVTHQAKWRPVLGVVASWIITLPCAALLSALVYRVLRAVA